MKVPKHIRNKMNKLVQTARQVSVLSCEIDQFFIENGYDIEKLRCGCGFSLEELEYGTDVVDKLCRAIEEDNYGKNEDFPYEKYEE